MKTPTPKALSPHSISHAFTAPKLKKDRRDAILEARAQVSSLMEPARLSLQRYLATKAKYDEVLEALYPQKEEELRTRLENATKLRLPRYAEMSESAVGEWERREREFADAEQAWLDWTNSPEAFNRAQLEPVLKAKEKSIGAYFEKKSDEKNAALRDLINACEWMRNEISGHCHPAATAEYSALIRPSLFTFFVEEPAVDRFLLSIPFIKAIESHWPAFPQAEAIKTEQDGLELFRIGEVVEAAAAALLEGTYTYTITLSEHPAAFAARLEAPKRRAEEARQAEANEVRNAAVKRRNELIAEYGQHWRANAPREVLEEIAAIGWE